MILGIVAFNVCLDDKKQAKTETKVSDTIEDESINESNYSEEVPLPDDQLIVRPSILLQQHHNKEADDKNNHTDI